MFKFEEFFPVESIAPLLGGVLIWFGLNCFFIGPSIIGPRSAEKYYLPACMSAVQTGKQAHAEELQTLREQGEAQIQETMQNVARQTGQAAQGTLNTMLGGLFGGYPGGEEFMARHGDTLRGWGAGQAAPYLQAALQERLQNERADLVKRLTARQEEARRGVLHPSPAAFCGCVVSEGLSDRLELAAYSASLRIYAPPAIERLADGTMIHNTKQCGSVPVV